MCAVVLLCLPLYLWLETQTQEMDSVKLPDHGHRHAAGLNIAIGRFHLWVNVRDEVFRDAVSGHPSASREATVNAGI